jgi:hypothetical protein
MTSHFWMCLERLFQVLCYAHFIYFQNVHAISLKKAFTSHKRGKWGHHFPLHFLATYNFSCLVLNETIKHTKHRASLSKDSHTFYTIHWNMQRTNIICLPAPSPSWSYNMACLTSQNLWIFPTNINTPDSRYLVQYLKLLTTHNLHQLIIMC